MNISKRDDMGFDLTGPANVAFKVRDALADAWSEDDSAVQDIATQLAEHDDDSSDQVTVTLAADIVPDAADVLEADSDSELEQLGERLQAAMNQHNEAAIDEAERAASE